MEKELFTAKDKIHQIYQLDQNVYRISEENLVNCYLVVGTRKALLIDTGIGIGDLGETVNEITTLPLEVVMTHGHCDHTGGRNNFPAYWINGKDLKPVYRLLSSNFAAGIMKKASKNKGSSPKKYKSKALVLAEGQTFDLGDRTIRYLEVPGHTKGSIALIDDRNKLMFTGDEVNPCLWMQLPGCTTIKQWLPAAEKLHELAKDHRSFYGHMDGKQDETQIAETIKLAKEMLDKVHDFPARKTITYPNIKAEVQIVTKASRLK